MPTPQDTSVAMPLEIGPQPFSTAKHRDARGHFYVGGKMGGESPARNLCAGAMYVEVWVTEGYPLQVSDRVSCNRAAEQTNVALLQNARRAAGLGL